MLNLTALVTMRGIMRVIISNGSQRLHVAYSMLLLQDDKWWYTSEHNKVINSRPSE
jgi:hypothetical protein